MQIAQVGLRGAQLLLTLLVTALIGNAIQTATAGNPASVNFAMFVCVLSWLAVLVGLASAWVESIPGVAAMGLDALAALFTFIIAVVLSAKLGVHSCGNHAYLVSNALTNGAGNMSSRCHELQASTAFFWFLFALFGASLVLMGLGGRGSGIGGGLRRGGPSMSQV